MRRKFLEQQSRGFYPDGRKRWGKNGAAAERSNVSASSSNAQWDSGAGTEEDPYISLAYAVDQAEDGDTICLMSDLTETKSARFWDKDLTIDGQGHTVFRGDGFERRRTWPEAVIIQL